MAEDKSEKLRIRLHVYDTDIPVNVRPEDEPLYRDAASLITNTINTYAARYKGPVNMKEIFEMELSRNDTQPYRDVISQLTSEIEDALKA